MAAMASVMTAAAGDYKVTVPLTEDEEGAMAYIINYDNGEKIDSVSVTDAMAVFTGNIDTPVVGRLIIDGARKGQFILEPGAELEVKAGKATGAGALNAAYKDFSTRVSELGARYNAETDQDTKEAIYSEYDALVTSTMLQNIDNPIGYLLFMDKAYDFAPAELEALVAQHPALTAYTRVNKLMEANRRKAATGEGSKFADFEIEYNGTTHRLSDVVGKGDYVLVDFWASWCGPCIRQTAVIKDIYKQYKDQGLKVLGVAVWDEPENTLKAIEKHELPWESWLNGQNIPTDIYGISGIPCIILFGPDGTILSRDKQSDELKAAVSAAMDK